MSAAILTNQGRNLFAQRQGEGVPLVIDRFLLANIPGLDPSLDANPDEVLPALSHRIGEYPVTRAGYINADKVVYSLYLGTGVGDFTFNWVGLLADDDTLVGVRYIDPLDKYQTVGPALGNAMTRNFLVTYTDAQAITNVTVDAAAWQFHFDIATETQLGLMRFADNDEAFDGTDDASAITPLKLANILSGFSKIGANDSFESGTRMVFQQSFGPVGWVKDTTMNDRAMRIVSGDVTVGGSVPFSTLFERTSVDARTISSSTSPSHGHGIAGVSLLRGAKNEGSSSGPDYDPSDKDGNYITPSNYGGSGSHSHDLDMRVRFTDVVIAVKE